MNAFGSEPLPLSTEPLILYTDDEEGFIVMELKRWLNKHGFSFEVAPPCFHNQYGDLEPVSLRAGQAIFRNVPSITGLFFHAIDTGQEVPGFNFPAVSSKHR